MTERVLPYDRGIVPQDTGYWCGPASTQTVLNTRGINANEADLARAIGTTVNGTDYVGLIERELDRRLPDARYTSVYLPNDPPTPEQKSKLWLDIVRSIDNGFGVVMNWVAPPGNKPRGVKGSPNPSYGGGTTYHYVAAMGWSDEGNNGRPSVWIADSGFRPFGYWCDFEQVATLIPPKGYCYADLPLIAPIGEVPVVIDAPPPPPPPVAVPVSTSKLAPIIARTIPSPSFYPGRPGLGRPRWIGVHTSESSASAEGLARFLAVAANEVSYHTLNDDREVIRSVGYDDRPWSARNANGYAFHHCFSHSFVAWSRDKWLEHDVADGFDEGKALTLGARHLAQLAQAENIPAVWIGGRNRPPWGLDGFCGHVDFAAWGGGHTDPGSNFPVNEFMRQVAGFLTGVEQPPLVTLPPVMVPGTDPAASKYAGVLIYRGRPNNDADLVEKVQHRLHDAYAEYGGHLAIDRDYSWSDELAIREFQRRSRLVIDGIVGPMTAAALKAW